MMFDLDPWGNFLCTGAQDGSLLIYDTNKFNLIAELKGDSDCINSVQFHPLSSLVGAVTGQRHFIDSDSGGVSDSDSDNDCESIQEAGNVNKMPSNYCFDLYKFLVMK